MSDSTFEDLMKDEIPDPIIPFGKYRGRYASDVKDVAYLDWLLGLGDLRGPFRLELKQHLERRSDWINYEP